MNYDCENPLPVGQPVNLCKLMVRAQRYKGAAPEFARWSTPATWPSAESLFSDWNSWRYQNGMVKQHPYFLSSYLPVFAQSLLNPHPLAHIPKFSLLSGTHLKQVYSSFLPMLSSGSSVREDSWENLIDVVIFTPASCTESYEIPPPPLSPQFLCFRETCWQCLEGWLFPIVLHDSKAKCPQGEGWPPNWWRDGDKRIPLGTKRQKYHLQNHSPLRSAEKE